MMKLAKARTLWAGRFAAAALGLMTAAAGAAACPSVSVHPDTARLIQMGAGGDANARAYEAMMSAPKADCQTVDAQTNVNLTFQIDAALAPNVEARAVRVPYFVAVLSGGKIVAKEIFPVALSFSTTTQKLSFNETVDKITLPVPDAAAAKAYEILVGFQLTPAQLRAVQN